MNLTLTSNLPDAVASILSSRRLFLLSQFMHLTLKGWSVRRMAVKDHRGCSSPSNSVLLEGGSGSLTLKVPVLVGGGQGHPQRNPPLNTPTIGSSGSSKLSFLVLYAKECQDAGLGLWEVSPHLPLYTGNTVVPKKRTSGWGLPWDRTQLQSGEGLS